MPDRWRLRLVGQRLFGTAAAATRRAADTAHGENVF
jgi:hypothetical protein